MCLSSDLPSSNFIAHAAAAAELLDDAVVRNGLAYRWRRILRL
jgi:hypothetical protein